MEAVWEEKNELLAEVEKLHHRLELSQTVPDDWYEPGMMEYLNQSEGMFESDTGALLLRFESRGTRYDGRTEEIERLRVGDEIELVRDPGNPYNPNNFTMLTAKGKNVGNMPAELCNAIAPLYDRGVLRVDSLRVSYVEPISKRSRHARQAVLFVELRGKLNDRSE